MTSIRVAPAGSQPLEEARQAFEQQREHIDPLATASRCATCVRAAWPHPAGRPSWHLLRLLQLFHRRFGTVAGGAVLQAWHRAPCLRGRSIESGWLWTWRRAALVRARASSWRWQAVRWASCRDCLRRATDDGAGFVVGGCGGHRSADLARVDVLAVGRRGRRDCFAVACIWWTLRSLGAISERSLLAGQIETAEDTRPTPDEHDADSCRICLEDAPSTHRTAVASR